MLSSGALLAFVAAPAAEPLDAALRDFGLAASFCAAAFVGFRVVTSLDTAGSDHRPVVAQLRPVA